nr:hypothetical protein [Tanacetum cinerariifolium]
MITFFWVDDFACPVRFSWHTAKNVTMDPAPEFLCLVGLSRHYTLDEETYPLFFDKGGEDMDIFAFIHTSVPTKVKVVERERKEDEPRLLETTVGRTVPLLPAVPDCDESELDASGMNIQPVTKTTDVVVEDVIPLQPRRLKKIKTIVADAGGPSHPPKKLREDHGTLSGVSLGGKSMYAVQRLFTRAVQNAEAFRSSNHTATTTITSTVDPIVVVKEKIIEPSLFAAESTFAGGTDPAMAGLTDLTGSDILVGGIRTVINPDSDLQNTYLLKARDEEVKNLKAQLLLKEAEVAEAICHRAETSKLETAEKSLRDEVNALNE